MSQPPQSDRRTSNTLPKSHPRNAVSVGGSTDTSPSHHATINSQQEIPPRSAPALPSLATLTGEFEHTRESGRPDSPTLWPRFGVRNILNPTADVQVAQVQPVSGSPQTPSIYTQSVQHAHPSTSPHIRKRGEPAASGAESHSMQIGRTGRRILTPRSPRAASLGSHRSPSAGAGLINRVPLPSGGGRIYTVEPGDSHDSTVPPLPTFSSAPGSYPPMAARDLVSPAAQATTANSLLPSTNSFAPPPPQEHRGETGRPRYSSSESSPSAYPPNQNQVAPVSGTTIRDNQTNYSHSTPGPVRSGLPYGQTDFQLTFETQQGPMVVPVNVDYQQASKIADEKRRRNAGASARFRARRKEKEREANQTISGLQQEMQELMEEREFYLRERNFFRDLLARSNPAPLPVRPHSPPVRRAYTISSAVSDGGTSVDYRRQESEGQRRQSGDYQPVHTSHSPATPYNPPFPPSGPSMTLPMPSASASFIDHRAGLSGPPSSTSRPSPYDPLHRNTSDRDWNAGR